MGQYWDRHFGCRLRWLLHHRYCRRERRRLPDHIHDALVAAVRAAEPGHERARGQSYTAPTIPGGGNKLNLIRLRHHAGTYSGVYSRQRQQLALSPFGGGSDVHPIRQLRPITIWWPEGRPQAGKCDDQLHDNSQTSLDVLWGTVDIDTGRNVTLTAGGETVTGNDIIDAVNAAIAGALSLGYSNL